MVEGYSMDPAYYERCEDVEIEYCDICGEELEYSEELDVMICPVCNQ